MLRAGAVHRAAGVLPRFRFDWRTFRADRITPLPQDLPAPRFVPREPPSSDAAAHVLRGVTTAPFRYRVRVRFAAPAAAIAERSTPTSGRITPHGDDECELATGTDRLHDLVTYLSKFEAPFTVLDPPELRDFLRALATRYLAAAQPDDRSIDKPGTDGHQ